MKHSDENESGASFSAREKARNDVDPETAELRERLSVEGIRKKRRRRLFYLLTAFLLSAVFLTGCAVYFFRVKNVEIEGNAYYDSETIKNLCGFSKYSNLFLVSASSLQQRIVPGCPYIKTVRVTRVLPSTVRITVTEEAPVYRLTLGDEYYLLSPTLRVIERCRTEDELAQFPDTLIRIETPRVKSAIVGSRLAFMRDANYDFLLALTKDLAASPFAGQIDSIDASDKYHISLILSGGRYKIELGDSQKIDTKLSFVKAVMEQSIDDTLIALFNVAYVDSVIVTIQSTLFDE